VKLGRLSNHEEGATIIEVRYCNVKPLEGGYGLFVT